MSAHPDVIGQYARADLRTAVAPARTLLLVIDVQVDFASPDGAMGRLGLDLVAVEPAVDRIALLLAQARRSLVPIALVRTITRPHTDPPVLRALHRRLGLGEEAAAICRAGTPGAGFHRLRPEAGDLDIHKTRYSAFTGTDLERQLRARGRDTVVVAGLTTDCCVDFTARDAFSRDFHVLVAADACADYAPEHHRAALDALGRHCALVVDSDAVVAAWADARAGDAPA